MKGKILKNKNLLPILILCCLSIWTIVEVIFIKSEYEGELYDKHFSIANYIAFSALITDLIFYFYLRKYFKYTVFATVILGLLGILNYHSTIFTFVFIIPFQPTSLLIAILYLGLNYERTKTKLLGKNVPEEERQLDLEKIDTFKRKFLNKSTEELEELLNDRRFVKEAKVASTQILEERNAQKPNC
jgi:hypothetical protein